jgi:hypothetical protein
LRFFPCSLTINPPLYGADTPMSLSNEKLPYGWNLRDLSCSVLMLPVYCLCLGATTCGPALFHYQLMFRSSTVFTRALITQPVLCCFLSLQPDHQPTAVWR